MNSGSCNSDVARTRESPSTPDSHNQLGPSPCKSPTIADVSVRRARGPYRHEAAGVAVDTVFPERPSATGKEDDGEHRGDGAHEQRRDRRFPEPDASL